MLYGAGSFAESSATKMEILFHYLRLSFFPWQLSWDYSYNEIPIVNWSSVSAWISLLLYGALLAYAVLQARKKPVISFAILFYMIMLAPTANLFFLNGSTVSERFLFLPSLGFVIALVYGLAAILKTNVSADSAFGLNKFTGILLLVILVFAGLTISRSNEWKSNLSIFQSGVENAPNSARTNAALGVESRKAAEKETDPRQRATYFRDAIKYSKESLDILPSCKDALYNLGVTYMETGDSANAVKTYHNLLYYYPDHRSALTNLGAMFFSHNRFDSAYQYLKRSYDSDTTFAKSSQSLAIYYFKLADYSQAIKFAGNAIRLDKSILISYDLLSQAYKAIGNEGEADKYKMLYQQVYMEASESGNTFSDTE